MRVRSSVHAEIVGRCGAIVALRARIAQVAPSELAVHVYGETGTGKEGVARALHALSPRAARAFVPVNAAGFPDELFCSEMFGHARGAFTGATGDREGHVARADRGTLFIDEVADLSPLAQVRLLRFLQEREYVRLGETIPRRADVRVLSATNVDLDARVRAGRFRKDLLYRLRDETLVVPPLRERGPDVPLLARHFLRLAATVRGERAPDILPEAEAALLAYDWPGNVRQLESEMRRLAVLVRGRAIGPQDLGAEITGSRRSSCLGLRAALQQAERELLRETLERCDGVQARAARALGITRQALGQKLRRLGLLPGEA
jgi:two-component system response regulator HydG